MKKSLLLLAGMAAILAACTKELDAPVDPANGGLEKVTIIASISNDTKTTLDGTEFSWGDSENIVVADGTTTSKIFTVSDKAAGTFTGTKDGDLRFAATPAGAISTVPATGTVVNVYMPGAYDFVKGTNALMVAGAPEEEGEVYKFTFKHAAALIKIPVQNLPVGTKTLRFTSDQYISGYAEKDLSGVVEITNSDLQAASKTVLIGLENAVASPNSSKTFYIPVPVGSYKEFTVELLDGTSGVLATKSKVLGTAVSLAHADVFETPVISLPGVAMPYACLTYDDYDATSGTGTSYAPVTVTKTHGDAWETIACKSGDAIQVGRFDSGSHKNSYIKLPDFADNINNVVVTLKSVTADKTINLESTADGTTGDILSVTTTDDLVYDFDVASAGAYKTAYLRVSGAATLVSKIEVWAGTDTRTVLADPTGVTASLDTTDPAVTNTVNVSWTGVENAGSYVVGLLDGSSNLTTFETTGTSYAATGLLYNTAYTVTVQAIPADPYVYKPSGAAGAASAVTTGAEPGGAKYIKVTDLADVTTGEYVIAAYVGSKYYAMSNTFAKKPTGTEVVVAGDKITAAAAADYTVTLTVGASGDDKTVTIYNGSEYLNCKTSGTDFEVGSTGLAHLISAGSAGSFRICHPTTTGRAVLYSTSGVFGNYSTGNAGNGTYYDVELFKLDDPRADAGLAWTPVTPDPAIIGDGPVVTFTAPSLVNPNGVDVTYSSNNDAVATVDASTGAVSIVGGGEVVISANFAGNTAYKPATASYTLTVTDSRSQLWDLEFTPGAGAVAAGTTVTISCAQPGVTVNIYYTTDGSEPSNVNGTLYTEPVTINDATTIKAIAYENDNKHKPSNVATAAYTIEITSSSTVAEVLAAGAGTYNMNNLLVYDVKGKNAIVGDSSGKMLLYMTNTLAVGDNINIASAVTTVYQTVTLEITGGTITTNSSGNTVDHGTATDFNDAAAASATNTAFVANGFHPAVYVSMTGTQSGQNITGSNTTLHLNAANSATDTKTVMVTGYVYSWSTSFNNYNFQAVSIAEDTSVLTVSVDHTSLGWGAAESGSANGKTITVTLNGDAAPSDYSVSGGNADWTVSDDGNGTITVYPNAANTSTTADKSVTLTIAHADDSSVYKEVTLTQTKASSGSSSTEEITSGTFSGDANSLSMTTTSGITIKQLKNGGTNCNTSYNSVSTLRVYRANQMQFTGKTFTKIEMYYTGSYSGAEWTVADGDGTVSIDSSNKKVVWENSAGASTVTLQNSKAGGTNTQLRTTKFVVTYE
jgi:hypothetical protein